MFCLEINTNAEEAVSSQENQVNTLSTIQPYPEIQRIAPLRTQFYLHVMFMALLYGSVNRASATLHIVA